MEYTTLGRTGLRVSVMGLGGGGDSRLGVKEDEARGVRLVRLALDLGVNFIDTAEAYGTEAAIGRALREVPRGSYVLSTKKTTWAGEPLTPRTIRASLEASLRRLGTDYVDIYHLHGVPPELYSKVRDDCLPTLLEIKREGKVRHLGITEKFVDDPQHRMLEEALKDDLWDVVMVGFNLLNQSARERVFAATRAKNVGTLIMFAVRRALSRPDRLREVLSELQQSGQLSPLDARDGLSFLLDSGATTSLPEAAYRFCRYEPGAHVVLSGTSDEAHLRQNAVSLGAPELPIELRRELLRRFGAVDRVSGH
ncbi:MAG: aldo/keto reductase [Myxococcales bacterium]|nr:MAG: aldo/keto reductase [Myxococcales bacterium]